MGRMYAGVLGFLAFAVTVARGVIDGRAPGDIVLSACLALAAFAFLGAVAGTIGDSAVRESVESDFRAELEAHAAQAADELRSGRME